MGVIVTAWDDLAAVRWGKSFTSDTIYQSQLADGKQTEDGRFSVHLSCLLEPVRKITCRASNKHARASLLYSTCLSFLKGDHLK